MIIANITYQYNGDFSRFFKFVDRNRVPVSFSGSTFKMEIRPAPGSATLTLTATLDVTDIANGRIGIGWAKNAIALGTYSYDLLQITAGKQVPIMKGSITIVQGTTV